MTSLLDIFDSEPAPKPAQVTSGDPVLPTPAAPPTPSGPIVGHGLKDETRKAARAAAEAMDAESAARAALDAQATALNAKVEQALAGLDKSYKDAKARRIEAEAALMNAMKAEKITRLPMDDRPDIQIKTTLGRKQSITKTWLDDPEGVVVKTYGPDAPDTIWNAVPKSDPRTDIMVPARYDDEPSR